MNSRNSWLSFQMQMIRREYLYALWKLFDCLLLRMNQSSATSVTSFASILLAIGRAIVLKFTPVCVWIWQFISRGFLSALCLAQFSSAQLYAVLILIATLAIGNGVILLEPHFSICCVVPFSSSSLPPPPAFSVQSSKRCSARLFSSQLELLLLLLLLLLFTQIYGQMKIIIIMRKRGTTVN